MRRKNKEKPKLITPCIRVCRLHDGSCIGCKRTEEEISNWFWYTDDQKKTVMEILKTR
jgi:predicted Fe-S protein YdhL (DUF1289 family)